MGNCPVCNKEDMKKQEILDLLLGRFYENFAVVMSDIIIKNRAVNVLYDLATDVENNLPKEQQQKIMFRAAYVLETIYFRDPDSFYDYRENFCRDFLLCTNESAKRHFTKIMAHLLIAHHPSLEMNEKIAEVCTQWVIEPKTRVAVVIGAVEVMLKLRNVAWMDEVLDQILEVLARRPSPGLEVRLKRWNGVRTL